MHSTMKSVTSEGMAGTATKNHLHLAGCIEIVGKLLLIRFIWSFTLSSRIGEMVQPLSFSIKTPLGWLVPTKISFVLSPHRTMLYDTAPLLGINRNSFDFKASRDDLVESLEAAIAKQAQRIKRLVFIVRLLEAQ